MKFISSIITLIFSIFLLAPSIAYAQLSLADLQTRFDTHLGSPVVVFQNGTPKAYAYGGELIYDLEKVPVENRDQAIAGVSARFGFDPNKISEMVTLTPLVIRPSQTIRGRIRPASVTHDRRNPKLVHRSDVFPISQALLIDQQGVTSLGIPDQFKFIKVRQVPWAITQTDEYKRQRAEDKPKEEIAAAMLGLMWLNYERNKTQDTCMDVGHLANGKAIPMGCN